MRKEKVIYKVVETSVVTEEELERIINRWVRDGWQLDGIQFAMREASRRPAMAFIIFVRGEEGTSQTAEGEQGYP